LTAFRFHFLFFLARCDVLHLDLRHRRIVAFLAEIAALDPDPPQAVIVKPAQLPAFDAHLLVGEPDEDEPEFAGSELGDDADAIKRILG
jgi:hypothetical protein